jgi:hypothetical protein
MNSFRLSFFRIFELRLLLTPFGSLVWEYPSSYGGTLAYRDFYVFGIRVARWSSPALLR